MTTAVTETKECQNIDYTNTTGYKTVKAYNKEGVYHGQHQANAPSTPGIPLNEFGELKFLRLLDSKLRKDKGPILKKITHIHRKKIAEFDTFGKKVEKEYLFFTGEFRGTTWNGEEDARGFTEGYYRKPIISKVYKFGKKFDPETGQDLGEMRITNSKLEYYYELPKSKTDRKRFIDAFIDSSPGTWAENIHYYYDSPDGEVMGRSDNTFSYDEFVNLSYEEMRNLSSRGGGAKATGYYRTPDGKLHDREGNLVNV